MWFATWKDVDGEEQARRFWTLEQLLEWLQTNYDSRTGTIPTDFSIYKAECLFDGS